MARAGNSEIISVAGPSTIRPELNPRGHDYAFLQHLGENDYLTDNLELCTGAINKVYDFEKWLSETVVQTDSSFLLRLEKVILNLAATSGITAGVYYHLALEQNGQNIVRYFESGLYDGAMENVFQAQLEGHYGYRIYTAGDVESQSSNLAAKSTSIGDKRQKDPERKRKVKNRSGQRYKQLMEVSDGSSLKPLLQDLLIKLLQEGVKVKSLVIGVLREKGKLGKPDDRYLYVEGHDTELVQQQLHEHSLHGKRAECLDVKEKRGKMSLKEQFSFLSSVSNLHWQSPNVMFMQTLSVGTVKYLPVSVRNRYIYFSVIGDIHRAKMALSPSERVQSNVINNASNPCKKPRMSCPTTQLTTQEMLNDAGELQAPDVSSMSKDLTLYKDYVRLLVESGCVSWRPKENDEYVIAANDFSVDTGVFQACDYVHVYFTRTEVRCSCSSFKDMVTQSAKCMHTRFVKEEIQPRLELLCMDDFSPNTPMEKLLHSNFCEQKSYITVMGRKDGKTLKFSVKGRTGSMGFVHTSQYGQFMACQSGACVHMMGSKKSTQKLMQLDELKSLCPHLDAMHAHHEVWRDLLDLTKIEEGDNVERQYFDTGRSEWTFGGLSQHKPPPERAPEFIRKVRERIAINDTSYNRDEDGYFVDVTLKPEKVPEICPCGAGYADSDREDNINLVLQYKHQVALYMRHGAAKCWVFKRKCKSGCCTLEYTGEEDGIYFWSSETAVATEVLYDFERQLFSRTTFSSFCHQMSLIYKSSSFSEKVKFMSSATFVNCFFGWLASMKIDFRQHVDPWCGYNPKFLACDGTHVGISIKKIDMVPMDEADLDESKIAVHTRFNRVFLPYEENNKRNAEQVRKARVHLKYLSNKHLKNCTPMAREEEEELNRLLLSVCPEEARGVMEIFAFNPEEVPTPLLLSLAKLMKLLASDAAMESLMPYAHIAQILAIIQTFSDIDELQKISCNEIHQVVNHASSSLLKPVIQELLWGMARSILTVHKLDVETQEPVANIGSYDPSSGVAYYFSPSGEQVRKLPRYLLKGKKPKSNYDDEPEEACVKVYPSVGKGGFSFMFLWFCPIHGHCYGFHLIPGAEGRKDPFSSLLKYLPEPPEHVFYDFACSLSEYSLNREPSYFRNVRFWHDIFHSLTHVCGDAFKSERVKGLSVNSEICEQFNSHLQNIKHTATHLSQAKFCFLMQYTLYKWNKKCTEACERKIQVKDKCTM